jgi:hypothetical protein
MRSDTHDEASSGFSQFCERAKKLYSRCTKFCLLWLGQKETKLCVAATCGGADQLRALRMCIGFNVFINQDDSQNVIYDLNIDPLELRNYALSNVKIEVDIKRREVEDGALAAAASLLIT